LDTLNPATAGEARRSTIMARKNYTDEFRRQAVDLYRSTPGATLRGIAADLGISRHTLNDWVHAQTATAATASDGILAAAAAPCGGSSRPGRADDPRQGRTRSAAEELAALRARVAALQTEKDALVTEQAKLATERDILRQAAKYFAGETHW
jgi:transposase